MSLILRVWNVFLILLLDKGLKNFYTKFQVNILKHSVAISYHRKTWSAKFVVTPCIVSWEFFNYINILGNVPISVCLVYFRSPCTEKQTDKCSSYHKITNFKSFDKQFWVLEFQAIFSHFNMSPRGVIQKLLRLANKSKKEEKFAKEPSYIKFKVQFWIGHGNRDHATSSNRGRLERFI